MGDPPAWFQAFTKRQVNEILFARRYADEFNHGTDGHNRLVLIARMADLLDALEAQGADVAAAVAQLADAL